MFTNFDFSLINGKTVAVAVSGGSDSMALLHFMLSIKEKYNFNLKAINVEHGIRGDASISDSQFVEDFCLKHFIPLIQYSVNAPLFAKENKLSIEQSARILRYDCFKTAINSGNCDFIATAHHQKDNAETVLLNLFRGTGLKGLKGISNFDGKILRPFLSVPKKDITNYLRQNSIPFVTDESNFCDDVTRNNLRINVLPKIEQIFPDFEQSITRFSASAKEEDEFLDSLAKKAINKTDKNIKIDISIPPVLFKRACIIAFKLLGIDKDWEKAHVDAVFALTLNKNGAKAILPKGITAIKEYDSVCIFIPEQENIKILSFSQGNFEFFGKKLSILPIDKTVSLTSGFFIDSDKLPKNTIIRTKRDGDLFTKFGGGTKKLNDYFTDKKIPLRLRDSIPIIADENKVLAIFGVAVSDCVKIDENTKNILQLKIF